MLGVSDLTSGTDLPGENLAVGDRAVAGTAPNSPVLPQTQALKGLPLAWLQGTFQKGCGCISGQP